MIVCDSNAAGSIQVSSIVASFSKYAKKNAISGVHFYLICRKITEDEITIDVYTEETRK